MFGKVKKNMKTRSFIFNFSENSIHFTYLVLSSLSHLELRRNVIEPNFAYS